jgi:hypothetical protein
MNKDIHTNNSILNKLAEIYPQLYLDPDNSSIEQFKAVLLQGERPEICNTEHFAADERDSVEYVETPAGEALVITLYNRHDFELFVRCMMAAKNGPYSNVKSDQVNLLQIAGGYELLDESEWIRASDDIRKYHELTHFVCRRLYPDVIDEVRDELIADAVGICAAFGEYRRDLEELFLGISGDRYTGGRLENYTGEDTDMDDLAKRITSVLKGFEAKISEAPDRDIFNLMSELQLSTELLH